jgi:hypothetical protein
MKKILFTILSCIILLSIVGCKNVVNQAPTSKNEISSYELTEEEKNILDLVGKDEDFNIYEYEVDDPFKSISIWLETYHNGELVSNDTSSILSLDERRNKGKIAINVDRDKNYKWEIAIKNANTSTDYSFNTNNKFELDDTYGTFWSSALEPEKIISDQEIILCHYIFDKSDGVSVFNSSYYLENPEALKEYDHTYLLKCKFSTKTIHELNDK